MHVLEAVLLLECVRLSWLSFVYSEGWYCSGGAVQPMPTASDQGGACDLGEYCPGGSDAPIPCDGGYFCDRVKLALPTGPCQQG